MCPRLKNTDFTAFQRREARLSDRLAVQTVPFPHAAARLCTLLDMQTSAGLQTGVGGGFSLSRVPG